MYRSISQSLCSRHGGLPISSLRSLSTAAAASKKENFVLSFDNPYLQAEIHPGSRLYRINQPNGTNALNTLAHIKHKITIFQSNPTVGAVVISVENLDLLSTAMSHGPPTSDGFNTAHKAIGEFSNKIKSNNKTIIAIFDGSIKNAALSAFDNATYKIGTRRASFQLTGLAEGLLPVGAGLLQKLVRSCPDGLAVTRFLAISEKPIDFQEMYALNLVSHMCGEKIAGELVQALAHTLSDNDNLKAVQGAVVHTPSLSTILDTLHLCSDELAEPLEGELFDQVLLVPPNQMPLPPIQEEGGPNGWIRITELRDFLRAYFESNDGDNLKNRLKSYLKSNPSPTMRKLVLQCMKNLEKISPRTLRAFYLLTKKATEEKGEKYQDSEMKMMQEALAISEGVKDKENKEKVATAEKK